MSQEFKPCPSCPDGNEWSANGPTSRACQTCGGFAILHLNGAKLTKQEFREACGSGEILRGAK